MKPSRRRFLSWIGMSGVGALALGLLTPGAGAAEDAAEGEKLKILFLGGTGFLGPHTIEILKDHGHEITLFNRGNRKEMFPELELIEGNRITDIEPGLTPLEEAVKAGRRWDAVVDTASVHRWTEDTVGVLKDAADHYIYISSLSAYAETAGDGRHEDDALATMPDDVADSIDRLPYDMRYYGAVKARSEAAALNGFPGKSTVLRPGLIVGPRDFTHRFSYWPLRVRDGGEILAPGQPSDPVMFIDVRDLAAFLVDVIEHKTFGVFNANGPISKDMTIGKLLDACKNVTGSDAEFTWADADFLGSQGVGPWQQMPVWIPPVGEYEGFHKTSLDRAKAAGLKTRPVEETIADTLAWFDEWLPTAENRDGAAYQYLPGERTAGISREREAEVLQAWKSRGEAENESAPG